MSELKDRRKVWTNAGHVTTQRTSEGHYEDFMDMPLPRSYFLLYKILYEF